MVVADLTPLIKSGLLERRALLMDPVDVIARLRLAPSCSPSPYLQQDSRLAGVWEAVVCDT